MKHLYSILLIAVLASLFFSCAKKSVPEGESNPEAIQKSISIAAPVANSITEFSFDFFKTLQNDPEYAKKNTFVSPLSLHIALGMLVNGATGTTKAEIMQAIHAESLSQEDLNATYKTLLNDLPKADPKVQLALANSIWYRNSFPVEADFLNTMKNSFNAKIAGLPFVPSDINTINQWAADNTNQKIKKVLSTISPDDVMFLMNALYFKGDWTNKFDKSKTKDQIFNLQGGSTKTVKMMNKTDNFDYFAGNDFAALQLPYGNKQFSATIILPNEGKTIESIMDNFDFAKWNQLQSSLHSNKVIVGLPKFKLEQEFMLNKTMQNLGMQKAFKTVAELTGISKPGNIYVSFVKQNTFAAVDEEGTEAAAVTTIAVGVTSVGPGSTPKFVCDRPFAIIISEKTSNTILFMGKIMNPEFS